MPALAVVVTHPPTGSRTADKRRRSILAARLLDRGQPVSDGRVYVSQAGAYNAARTMIANLDRHTRLCPGQLRRTVWQVSTGRHSGSWRFVIVRTDLGEL